MRCPCCRRRSGFRFRLPPSVTVVAVTGAVNAVIGAVTAVTWGRDPAMDVTGTVPAVITMAGCHSGPTARAISHSPHWGHFDSIAHETYAQFPTPSAWLYEAIA
jgi:hypothetical protein